MNRILMSLCLAVITQSLLWLTLIPVWQYPDEQAHFAQVQNYAESGRSGTGLNSSAEIYETEKALDTLRDIRGNNAFTYHPEYRLAYSDTNLGIYETYLKTLPLDYRTRYVQTEAPAYPPLYYRFASVFYRLGYSQNIFNRIYLVRFGSLLLFLLTVWFSWRLFKRVFREPHLALAATMAVAYQPSFMFVGTGINNDILLNLLSVALIFITIKDLNKPLTLTTLLPLFLVIIAGIFTKQLIYLLLPSIGLTLIYRFFKHRQLSVITILISCSLLLVAFKLITNLNEGFWLPFWPKVDFHLSQFISLLTSHLSQLYRETLPWYWGVYKWLSVVLPLWLLRLIKSLMALSLVGWFIAVKRRRLSRIWLLLLLFNIVYAVTLVIWDIFLSMRLGFGHGLQGRYFFPLLTTHMAFLVYGWFSLIPPKYYAYLLSLITLVLVLFNYYSLYYVISQYHSLSSFTSFINEASQYKPDLVKWPGFGVIAVLSFVASGYLLFHLFRYCQNPKKNGEYTLQ